MDSQKNAVFRSALGGFNKKDVNSYIATLSEKNNDTIRELEGRLATLDEQLEQLRGESSAATEAEQELTELRTRLEQAEALIAAQNEQLEARADELEAAKRRADELEAQLGSLGEVEDKLRDYNIIKSKLGEIMADAASSAEKLKADAADTVQARLDELEAREAELTARQERRANELEERYQAALRAVNERLEESARGGLAALNALLRSAGEDALAAIEKKRADIDDVLASAMQNASALPELSVLRDGESK